MAEQFARQAGGAPLSVNLLGGCSLTFGDRPVDVRGRKAKACMAYLALHHGQSMSRERLVGLFWSESGEEKARASLRQTIRELRDAFEAVGFKGFNAERLGLEIQGAEVKVDTVDLFRSLEAGVIPGSLLEQQRLAESVLAGYEELDPSFRIWLLAYRQTSTDRLIRNLEAMMDGAVPPRMARDAAQALLNLDPTHEVACRHLIRAKADAGDTAGALKIYKTLWDLLETDYDTEPAAETQALVVSIKLGDDLAPVHAPAEPANPPTTAERPQIAVPQVRMIELAELQTDRLLCFRHELLACLVRFREWQIVDHGEMQRVAPAPGADRRGDSGCYIVESSAYGSQTGTHLVLTLRDFVNSSYVWSERFDLSVANWFDVQREIARRIAAALRINISAERITRLARRPNLTVALHDRWVQGQALFNGYRADEFGQAEAIFRSITERDDGFSPAFSSLAQLKNSRHLAAPGKWRSSDTEAESLVFAQRAAQIDPIDSRAQLCLAWSQAMAGMYDAAHPSFHSAVALNDGDPWTLTSAAHGLAFLGDMDQAQLLERQMLGLVQMPSRTQWAYLVGTRFLHGDYAGSLEAAGAAQDIISNLPGWKAATLHHLGRHDEARAEMRRFLTLIRNNWHGTEASGDEAIIRWFLHNFPIHRRSDWERLRDGVHGAGAPFVHHEERRPVHIALG
ncbi:BTAD domain-containing putative transcriptional regulator [Phreatobacter stygius]|uniref:BTAD domain-containing putative transcriptional regulator n=1 Tax=Phreatobacter stygius TaxID=1940610 RepID=UPI0014770E62|nr:BTAD domain-containing putative transcriptional regulator [Phreatobacter stygius]